MNIIATPRRGGKTTMVAELAKKTGAILVVLHHSERTRIHKEHGLPLKQIVTFEQLKRDKSIIQGNRRPILLDNADVLLQDLCDGRLRVATFSVDAREFADWPDTSKGDFQREYNCEWPETI